MRYIFVLIFFISVAFGYDAFVKPRVLKEALKNDKDLIIVDVGSKSLYNKSHIVGALHADMKSFVIQAKNDNPYKLMKTPTQVREQLDRLGINKASHIVIYSHNTKEGILYSSYLAFLLIYNGFENVSILDGGYMAWVFDYDFLVSKEPKEVNRGDMKYHINRNVLAKIDDIDIKNDIILDTRDEKEYFGVKKTTDVRDMGHIKGAKSATWSNNFLSDDTIRSNKELKQMYIDGYKLSKNKTIVVYGKSPYDASMLWYILYKKMGFKNTKLYEASIMQWCDKDKPISRFVWE